MSDKEPIHIDAEEYARNFLIDNIIKEAGQPQLDKPNSIKDTPQDQEWLKQWAKIADNLGLAWLATCITLNLKEYLEKGVISYTTGSVFWLALTFYIILQSFALLQCAKVDRQNVMKDWIKEK